MALEPIWRFARWIGWRSWLSAVAAVDSGVTLRVASQSVGRPRDNTDSGDDGVRMIRKWLNRILWTFLALAMFSGTARADAISITGGAIEVEDSFARIGVTGAGIDIGSSTIDFGLIPVQCTPGSFCDMTISVPAALTFEGPANNVEFGGTSASVLGNTSANAVGGFLRFSGGAFIPAGSSLPNITIPVTLTGVLQGYDFINCPAVCFPSELLWTLDISGTGQATFSDGGGLSYQSVDYTFTGTAVTAPEPPNLILLTIGLLGVAAVWRRNRCRTHTINAVH